MDLTSGGISAVRCRKGIKVMTWQVPKLTFYKQTEDSEQALLEQARGRKALTLAVFE